MRMTNRHFCLLAALFVALAFVAVPATTFGQSAGDDQYVDPFKDNGNGNGNGNANGNGNSGSQGDTSAGTQQTTQTTTPTGDTAGETASDPAANGNTLPRTGEDYGAVVLMGVLLLGGGVALRLAWPLPE